MAQMTVEEFAKKLQSETGMVFHWRTIAKDLVKKKEGLKASSMINDDDMTYVRNKYVKTEEKKPEPKKAVKPAARPAAARSEQKPKTARRPMPITGGPVKPEEKRTAASDGARRARTASLTATVEAAAKRAAEKVAAMKSAEEAKAARAAAKAAEAEEKKKATRTVKKKAEAEEAVQKPEEVEEVQTAAAESVAAPETVAAPVEEKAVETVSETPKEAEAVVEPVEAVPVENTEEKKEAETAKAPEEDTEKKTVEENKPEVRVISSPIQEKQRPGKVLDAKTIAERIAASQSKREVVKKDRPQRPDDRRGDGRSRDPRERDNRDSRDRRPDGTQRTGARTDVRGRAGADARDNQGRDGRDSRFAGPRRNDRGPAAAPAADTPSEKFGKDRRDRHEKNRQDKDRYDRKDKDERLELKSRDDLRGKKGQKANTKLPVKETAPKAPEEPVIKNIVLPESITLKELAEKLKQPVNAMIKKLFMEGKLVTVNTELSFDDASMIALEYNYIADLEEKVDLAEEAIKDIEDAPETLTPRPPVVCVMGHVDHGKTSLLDAIRNSDLTKDEAGGITQHIGAYVVKAGEQRITFLDTPGHEAFTAMRLRGAQATDIAILVVAADDGVMPQTVEAINHAKAAGIEIIVAVNKIDKPSANVERVKQELMEYGLVAEEWGGSTIFCPVSARTHEGIPQLLDMILLTAEVLELKANAKRRARGVVIEARLDRGRGPVATLLVQKGTLHVGDFIAIGEVNGRVRAMLDHKQRNVKEATPSTPVEIIGLSGVPNSGDTFISTDTEKEARQISEAFINRGKENLIAETKARMSLDDLFNQMQEGKLKELKLIVKADVQGSVEAVKQSLLKLSNEEILIKVIHSGVGAINESDVTLASASGAIIIGFNIRPDAQAKQLSEEEKVDVRLYNVIYNAIDDIEAAMKGMLDPIYEEKITGHVEVRQVYKASNIGAIAGCYVLDGIVERNSSVRLTRDGQLIFDGKIASLKRFKDDVKEVKSGFECGIVLDGHKDFAEFDQMEVYKMVEVPRS